jgi:hypothetical protein
VKGRLDNTAIDWSSMGVGSAASRMIDFGVDGFRYNNFTFMKKKMDIFTYGGITNTALSPYPFMGFTVPWDKVRGGDGKELDTIRMRYMQNDRGSRYQRFWVRDEKITNNDQIEFNHKGEVGLELVFARQINKIYKA